MRNIIHSALLSVLVVSSMTFCGCQLLNAAARQQADQQNASPQQQQAPQASQPQASSSAAAQTVTGCLVRTDNGYSLKTDTDTYPIETGKDLSQYVNKRLKVTGILEHHQSAAPSTANSNAVAITDIRLRVVASVLGDCKPDSQ